jgi:hypothetical protein
MPILIPTRVANLSLTSTTLSSGWTVSAGTYHAALDASGGATASTNTFDDGPYGLRTSSPLILGLGSWTPVGEQILAGFSVDLKLSNIVIGGDAVELVSGAPKLVAAGGAKGIVPTAVQLYGWSGIDLGVARETGIYSAWNWPTAAPFANNADLPTSLEIVLTVQEEDGSVSVTATLDEVNVYVWAFVPTLHTAYFALPPHIRHQGKLVKTAGGAYSAIPYLTSAPFGAVAAQPDVVESVVAMATTGPGAIVENLGVRRVYAEDEGVWGRINIPVSKLGTGIVPPTAVQLTHRCGYQQDAGDYAWSAYMAELSSIQLGTHMGLPQKPEITVTEVANGIQLSGFSRDNLMPAVMTANRLITHQALTAFDKLASQLVSTHAGWNASWQPMGISSRQAYGMQFTNSTGGSSSGIFKLVPIPVKAGVVYDIAARIRKTGGAGAVSITLDMELRNAANAVVNTTTIQTSSGATPLTLAGTYTPSADGWAIMVLTFTATPNAGTFTLDGLKVARRGSVATDEWCQGGLIWGNAFLRGTGARGGGETDTIVREVTGSGTLGSAGTTPSTGWLWGTPTEGSIVMYDYLVGLPVDWPGDLYVHGRFKVDVTADVDWWYGLRFLDRYEQILENRWIDNMAALAASGDQQVTFEDQLVPKGTVRIAWIFGIIGQGASGNINIKEPELYFNNMPPTAIKGVGTGTILEPSQTPQAWIGYERLLPEGDWTIIGMVPVDPMANSTMIDYIFPENMDFTYRASVWAMIDGHMIQGPYCNEIVITSTDDSNQRWTLWDPTQDIGPLRFDISGSDPELNTTQTVSVGRFTPINRSRRVVTADVSKGQVFHLTGVSSIDEDEVALWESLHDDPRVMILTRAWTGECWPVMFTSDLRVTFQNTDPPLYRLECEVEEVDVVPVW